MLLTLCTATNSDARKWHSHSRFLCCSIPSFGVSAVSPKISLLFNIFSMSAIVFITCQNRHQMANHIRHEGDINNTFAIIFSRDNLPSQALVIFLIEFFFMFLEDFCKLSKTPSNDTYWEIILTGGFYVSRLFSMPPAL